MHKNRESYAGRGTTRERDTERQREADTARQRPRGEAGGKKSKQGRGSAKIKKKREEGGKESKEIEWERLCKGKISNRESRSKMQIKTGRV